MTSGAAVSAAELLRQARLAAGMTQVQLASRAGVTQSVISAYESSRREPALSTLQRLLEATGHRLPLQLEQVDGAAPRSLPRVGLGAALRRQRRQLRRIVAAHGGTVSVDSVVGRGTTFRVTLPEPTEPTEPTDGSAASEGPAAAG